MSNVLIFSDFNFKLAVIQRLMYDENVITPTFNIATFIEKTRGLKSGEGSEILDEQYMKNGEILVPEAKKYFENLEITASMVQHISELFSDGGDPIYQQIIPFWSGEDAVFDVTSAEDVKFLPKLKKARLLFQYPGNELKKAFKTQGVELYF